jgi:hypothetical protein
MKCKRERGSHFSQDLAGGCLRAPSYRQSGAVLNRCASRCRFASESEMNSRCQSRGTKSPIAFPSNILKAANKVAVRWGFDRASRFRSGSVSWANRSGCDPRFGSCSSHRNRAPALCPVVQLRSGNVHQLSTNFGSRLNWKVSTRCSLRSCCRQIRRTVDWLKPRALAIVRVLRCLGRFGGFPSSAAFTRKTILGTRDRWDPARTRSVPLQPGRAQKLEIAASRLARLAARHAIEPRSPGF